MSTELFQKSIDESQQVEFCEDYLIITDLFEGRDIYLSYEAAQKLADGLFIAVQMLDENSPSVFPEHYLEGTTLKHEEESE